MKNGGQAAAWLVKYGRPDTVNGPLHRRRQPRLSVRTAISIASSVPIGTRAGISGALESVHGPRSRKLDADDFLHILESTASRELITRPSIAGLLIEHLAAGEGAPHRHCERGGGILGPVDAVSPQAEPAVHGFR